MVSVSGIKRFVSNGFQTATLSGNINDGKLDFNLYFKGIVIPKYETVPCYCENLDELKDNHIKLCNYLLDKYLENNTVIGVNYFTAKPGHNGKNQFEILTNNGSLYISIPKQISINGLFPKFVERLETAKKEGIIKTLEDLKKSPKYSKNMLNISMHNRLRSGIRIFKNNYLSVDIRKSNESYYQFKYSILIDHKGNIPQYERDFFKVLIQQLLEVVDSTKSFNTILDDIDYIKLRFDKKVGYEILDLGRLVILCDSTLEGRKILDLIEKVIKELKPVEVFKGKQLTIGGFYGNNNGKIS